MTFLFSTRHKVYASTRLMRDIYVFDDDLEDQPGLVVNVYNLENENTKRNNVGRNVYAMICNEAGPVRQEGYLP